MLSLLVRLEQDTYLQPVRGLSLRSCSPRQNQLKGLKPKQEIINTREMTLNISGLNTILSDPPLPPLHYWAVTDVKLHPLTTDMEQREVYALHTGCQCDAASRASCVVF